MYQIQGGFLADFVYISPMFLHAQLVSFSLV